MNCREKLRWKFGASARGLLTPCLLLALAIASAYGVPSADLVGYWKFDGDYLDSSSYGNHGINHGTTFAAGRYGLGIALNGFDQFVEIPDSSSLDLIDFTVEAWVKLEQGAGKSQTVVDKSADGESQAVNSNYLLQTINDNRIALGYEDASGSGDQTVLSSSALPVGVFVHVAGVYDSALNQLRVYINGVEENVLAVTVSPPNQQNQPVLIGRNPGPNQFLEGVIDELRLWRGVRTEAEIQEDAGLELIAEIDIKPEGFPNSLNPRSRGVIPVAILSTASFDPTEVDVETIRFGATGTEAPMERGTFFDIDGDGDADLLLRFDTQQTGIQCGDLVAFLSGRTVDGRAFRGSDTVNPVGCGDHSP